MFRMMRVPEKGKVAATQSLNASFNSSPYKVDLLTGYSICGRVIDSTAAIGTVAFLSGVLEVQTLTFPAKADVTARDYIVIYDQSGGAWAAALNKSGSDAAPTGAAWVAIASGKKTNVDISAVTTAAQVAAAVKTALNLLVGFTAVITLDDSAADGTMLSTQVVRGPTTDPVPHNLGDTGAGTILGVQTTAGVATAVDVAGNIITSAAHGYYTGVAVRLTTTGTLPAGLAVLTTYYVIASTVDTFKLATSLANANIGTAIDITDFGTGTHTSTVQDLLTGTFTLQASNNCFDDNTNNGVMGDVIWIDVPSSTVTLDGNDDVVMWNVVDVFYEAVRIKWTHTLGHGTIEPYFFAKGKG